MQQQNKKKETEKKEIPPALRHLASPVNSGPYVRELFPQWICFPCAGCSHQRDPFSRKDSPTDMRPYSMVELLYVCNNNKKLACV